MVQLFRGYMIWLLPHPLSLSSRDTLLIGGELNDLNGKKVGPSIFHSIFSGSMIFFSMVSYYETVKLFSFLSLFNSSLQRVVYDRGSDFF